MSSNIQEKSIEANLMMSEKLMKVDVNRKIIQHRNNISSKFETFLPIIS